MPVPELREQTEEAEHLLLQPRMDMETHPFPGATTQATGKTKQI